MTLTLARAERSGARTLADLLHVPVPAEWPPGFYESDDLERMERLLQDPANEGWALYYLIHRAPARALVGVAGFSGHPTGEGIVEIGYSVVPSHRRLGVATEAVAALLNRAFQDPTVDTVVAETFPHLPASIGVLLRNGFQLAPDTGRDNTLRYELTRSVHAAGIT